MDVGDEGHGGFVEGLDGNSSSGENLPSFQRTSLSKWPSSSEDILWRRPYVQDQQSETRADSYIQSSIPVYSEYMTLNVFRVFILGVKFQQLRWENALAWTWCNMKMWDISLALKNREPRDLFITLSLESLPIPNLEIRLNSSPWNKAHAVFLVEQLTPQRPCLLPPWFARIGPTVSHLEWRQSNYLAKFDLAKHLELKVQVSLRNGSISGNVSLFTFRDHGLDGEGMAGLHDAHGLVFGVMRDIGGAMKQLMNPMTAIASNHGEPFTLGMLLDYISHFTILHTRFDALRDGLEDDKMAMLFDGSY